MRLIKIGVGTFINAEKIIVVFRGDDGDLMVRVQGAEIADLIESSSENEFLNHLQAFDLGISNIEHELRR